MKKLSDYDKYTLQMITAFAVILAVCMGAFVFLGIQTSQLHNGLLESSANEQLITLKNTAEHISEAPNEKAAVSILSELNRDGSHYWFLLSETSVIYDKDSIVNIDFSEASEIYLRNGASEKAVNNYFNKINEQNDFSVLFTGDKSYGRELICITFCKIGEKNYAVGYSVKESYILSAAGLNRNIICLRVLTAALCGLFVIISGIAVIRNYKLRGKLKSAGSELTEKNQLIQKQSDRILADGGSLADINPELYDSSFIHAMLDKIAARKLVGTGFIVIRLSDYTTQTLLDGVCNDMTAVLEAIRKYAEDTDICAQIREDMLMLVRINAAQAKLLETAQQIKSELNKCGKTECTIGMAISSDDVYTAVRRAVYSAECYLGKEEK